MSALEERRQLIDRRQRPTRPLSRYTLKGRRQNARRIEENFNYYVDRYEPRYWILLILTLTFCLMDIVLTLKLGKVGGSELNALMLSLMQKNLGLALFLKALVTFVGLTFLLIHKNFKLFGLKTHAFLYVFFFIYLTLFSYELYFYVRIISL